MRHTLTGRFAKVVPAFNALGRRFGETPFLLGVFAVAGLLVVARRPDAFLLPQFYMEDGTLWYQQAHELGWLSTLIKPARGYFQTSARLGASVAMLVPLLRAPLVLAVLAVVAEALPAVVIASTRFESILRERWQRVILAIGVVCLPNAWTTISNITHAQWYLSLAALLVVVAEPGDSRAWRAFDVIVLVLGGLSGPFVLFLVPIVAFKWWARRQAWTRWQFAIACACAVVQAIAIPLATETVFRDIHLGVSAGAFAQIFARQVVYAGVLGETTLHAIAGSPASLWLRPVVVGSVTLLVLGLLVVVALRAPLGLRLIGVFAALELAAALAYPPIPGVWWELLQNPGFANRYFIAPIFFVATALVWTLGVRSIVVRVAGIVIVSTMLLVGIRVDFRQPPLQDYRFAESVALYDRAESGEIVQIPCPPGWVVLLTKP